MISGYTALYGLIAHPAQHSLSPFIHNTGFHQIQMDARYAVFDSQATPAAITSVIKTLGIRGVNLSMPYKQSLVPLVDNLTSTAKLVGAINTIKNEAGRLTATNTDGDGFWCALQKAHPQRRYRSVTILGAGGAALAVIEAAVRYGVQQVTVFKRANATYDSVIQRLAQISLASGLQIIVEPYDDQLALATALQNADCLINATNIGMTATPGNPLPINLLQYLPEDSLVADLIYAPRETAFLKTAQKAHYQIQNGLGMLIEQAALSFEFWTNESMATMPIYQHLTGGNDAS